MRLSLPVAFCALFVAAFAWAGEKSAPQSPEARARDYFTDTELVTQEGQTLRFYSDVLRDRVVVINFIYTQCPDACPLLTKRLNEVRSLLKDRFGRDVFFVSISLDPETDTPERLLAFARRHQAEAPGWTFLTGTRKNVDEVVRRLGHYVENPADHATTFLAANVGRQRWMKVRPDLPPAAVVAQLQRLADSK